MNKFIILSSQRSGSTYFRLFLNTFQAIRCHGEVFLHKYNAQDGYISHLNKYNRRRLIPFFKIHRILFKFLMTKKSIYNYHNEIYHDKNFSNAFESIKSWNDFHINPEIQLQEAVGYKLMYSQLNNALVKYINENRISIIHLTRKNKLKQYLSKIRMKKTKVAHIDNSNKIESHPLKFYVNKKKLKKFIDQSKIHEEIFRKKFPNCDIYELHYENIQNDFNQVIKFIGIKNCMRKSEVSIRKINYLEIEDQISNYKEVELFCIKNNITF